MQTGCLGNLQVQQQGFCLCVESWPGRQLGVLHEVVGGGSLPNCTVSQGCDTSQDHGPSNLKTDAHSLLVCGGSSREGLNCCAICTAWLAGSACCAVCFGCLSCCVLWQTRVVLWFCGQLCRLHCCATRMRAWKAVEPRICSDNERGLRLARFCAGCAGCVFLHATGPGSAGDQQLVRTAVQLDADNMWMWS